MHNALARVLDQARKVILDKPEQLRCTLACLLAGGHLLIEDEPGTGKTTLARAMSVLLGLDFQRIQCTSDLLPGDILGVNVFDKDTGRFSFHSGPIFSQFILLDEINRTTPKTQSGLMQAMAEQRVSIDGKTHPLPSPFFVIATQNPSDAAGTYPLPDSQLDRFLMRITLGLPSQRAEMELLQGRDRSQMLRELEPALTPEELRRMQAHLGEIHVADAIYGYIQNILQDTRNFSEFRSGLSPRAGLALLACSRAWALIQGREYVLPEDVQAVTPWVAAHRLHPRDIQQQPDPVRHLQERLADIPIP
ncbi:MAG: MoxR family ATPase [Desulfohalobiaceae bacterium]|nr:MoxR family ATPase [Desulfohalobiaceae bacterium]